MPIRYVHTNIVARDWRRLAAFYCQALGCTPMPPERDLHGDWFSAATGIDDVRVQGVHLRLPGWGDDGPTLEIFAYSHELPRPARGVNQPGLAHLAFCVDDVDAGAAAVIAAGGQLVGSMVETTIVGAGRLRFCSAADPEGNVIELQHWR